MTRPVRIAAIVSVSVVAAAVFTSGLLAFIHASIRDSDAVAIAQRAVIGRTVAGVGTVTSTEFPRWQQMKLKRGLNGGGIASFELELKGPQGTMRHRFRMSKAPDAPWTINNPLPN
jgi:hypothetical protein